MYYIHTLNKNSIFRVYIIYSLYKYIYIGIHIYLYIQYVQTYMSKQSH